MTDAGGYDHYADPILEEEAWDIFDEEIMLLECIGGQIKSEDKVLGLSVGSRYPALWLGSALAMLLHSIVPKSVNF